MQSNNWKLIVIATAAEGIEAWHRALQSLRPGFPAAIVAVLHESMGGPGLPLDEISKGIVLPMSYAEHGAPIEPGRIFLAPRNSRVTIDVSGCFKVDRHHVGASEELADLLFESAAKMFGNRVIGVVLTGHGKHGTAGLRATHQAGGVGIVQSPADAIVQEMPMSALLGDHPSHVPLIEDIGNLLEDLAQQPLPRPFR